MKQLAYFIIGLGLGFLACKFLFQDSTPREDVQEVVFVKPKGVIDSKRAMEYDKFFNERHALISDAIGKPDNRSSWYALQDIKDYLAYAENQTTELKYSMDGIRIYLGSHGNKEYTTMFLVPTGIPAESLLKNNFMPPTSGDIPGGDVLNDGGVGHPPSANYPQ